MKIRPADIRGVLAAGTAALVGAVLAAQLPFVGVPLAAFALGWAAFRFGYAASSVVALVATGVAMLVLGTVLPAVFVLPALLVAGPGTAWALGRMPAARVIAVVTVVLVAAAVGLDAAVAASRGMSLAAARSAEIAQMRTLLIESGTKSGTNDAASVKALAEQFAQVWRMLWPSMYVYISGLAAVLSVPLVSRAGRALDRTVAQLPPMAEFDLTPHVVWPTIAGLGLLASAAFLHQPNGWMWAVGANLLLVVRPALFFQGVGDFAALYRKAGIGRLSRGIGFTFLTLSELAIPSVSVVGLVDIFANLRKLPRGGTGAQAGAAPA